MFDFFYKKKLNSALECNARTHIFHNLNDIKKVLILFSYQDWAEIQQVSQDLKEKGKEVLLWTTQAKKTVESQAQLPVEVRVLSHKDISKWRGLSSSVVSEFKALSYDTLLDLTTQDDKSLLYLLANNSAEFCIGIKEPDIKVYDFIVLKEENAKVLETYDQIKFYLNNIR
ncbi:hypothetical protein JGH11_16445 [Dysgonomonas sp. Marseille-P4677]|uniref:DUF6913 domain-containing protein n=1 Tax=Dysgonomonas sp. Marseille-P4677 TaxID=2364790 RepID=UPI0019139872|nr:hypothetical protein [Dysgonomonas sp. Marseille-P4677]MBK5722465.1 hypothetical protein [Dysgonomonas sp. Marseille-P4677]